MPHRPGLRPRRRARGVDHGPATRVAVVARPDARDQGGPRRPGALRLAHSPSRPPPRPRPGAPPRPRTPSRPAPAPLPAPARVPLPAPAPAPALTMASLLPAAGNWVEEWRQRHRGSKLRTRSYDGPWPWAAGTTSTTSTPRLNPHPPSVRTSGPRPPHWDPPRLGEGELNITPNLHCSTDTTKTVHDVPAPLRSVSSNEYKGAQI